MSDAKLVEELRDTARVGFHPAARGMLNRAADRLEALSRKNAAYREAREDIRRLTDFYFGERSEGLKEALALLDGAEEAENAQLHARIAALTTVTEDDVEAAARAICLENIRANGDGTAVDPFGWGEYLTDARAALADFVARKGSTVTNITDLIAKAMTEERVDDAV